MSILSDLRNRITGNLTLAVRQPAQFAKGISLGLQQVAPQVSAPRINFSRMAAPVVKFTAPAVRNYTNFAYNTRPQAILPQVQKFVAPQIKNYSNFARAATPQALTGRLLNAATPQFSPQGTPNLSARLMQPLANVQARIENPNPIKPFPTYRKPVSGITANVLKFIGNMPSDIGNIVVGRGIIDPMSDVGRVVGNTATGRTLPTYESLKSPQAKIGAQIANVIQPNVTRNLGIKNTPQEALANAGQLGEAFLFAFGGGEAGAAKNAVTNVAKESLKQLALKGGIKGAKFGATYGFLVGLAEGRDAKTPQEQLTKALIQSAIMTVPGFALGAAVPIGSAGFSMASEKVARALQHPQFQDFIANEKGFAKIPGGQTLLDEAEALKSARQGTGKFKGGEVYEQDLGKMGTRQVLVQGKDPEGNILGWYLPDKKSAEILGQKTGFLQPAKFLPNELQPSTTPTAQIKTAINFMFPEKQISGQLTQAESVNPEELKLVEEALNSGDVKAAENIYKQITPVKGMPKFSELLSKVETESNLALEKLSPVETAPRFSELGPNQRIAQKMQNFLRIAGEKTNKTTKELYREHIPRKIFGVSSDEIAAATGKTENEFMADIMPDMIATASGRANSATVNRFAMKVRTLKSLGDKLNPEFYKIIKGEEGKLTAVLAEATTKTLANAQEKALKSDYIDWETNLFKQEGAALTPKQYSGQGLKGVEGLIKTGTVSPLSRNIDELKDISGFKANWRDMYRNFKEVFGNKYEAAKRVILDPFDQAKGAFITNLNKWEGELDQKIVKDLGIKKGSHESAAVQEFGEGRRDIISLVKQFGEKKANNIVKADQWFRSSYNQLLKEVNTVRERIYPNDPEKIIPRRQDYYRHFRELAEGYRGLLNIFETPAGIPSTLAGISYQTEPKAKFLSFAQKRLGGGSAVDAVGGFIDYVKAAEYAKNIDPQIPRFRALATELAEQTAEGPNKGKLNNFILSLNRAADDLAGKTNPSDRWIQEQVPGGRTTFRVIDWINKRAKANVMLGNLSSSIAQIFNVPQGIADAGPVNATKGLGRALASMFTKNKPMEDSIFIKERFNKAFDKFDTGMLHNVKRFSYWVITVLDEVGTKYIWNAEYSKAIANKIDNPVRYADYMTREMVAGRGIGEVPLSQKARLTQMVLPFQIEVGNLWWVMKDMANQKAFGKLATLFITSYLFNRAAEQVRGSGVSFDPIKAVQDGLVELNQEGYSKKGWLKFGGRQAGEVLSNIPFGQTVAAAYPEYGMLGLGTRKELFGREDPTRFGTGVLIAKAAQDPFFKLLPPYGGMQVEKTLKGIKAYTQGYQANAKGKIQYPVAQNLPNLAKSVAFGPTSLPAAQKYFNTGATPLSEKQSAVVKASKDKEQAYQYFLNQRYINKIGDIYNQIGKGELSREDGLRQIELLKKKISSAVVQPAYAAETGNSAGGIKLSLKTMARTPTIKLKKAKKGKKVKLAKWKQLKAKTTKVATLKVKKTTKPTAYKIKGLKLAKTPKIQKGIKISGLASYKPSTASLRV